MKFEIITKDRKLKIIFSVISEIAEEMRAPAFVIGGFVRDIIINRDSTDIDIVIEGSGIDLAERVARKLKIRNVNIFKNFGTAMLNYDGYKIEFVGARKSHTENNPGNRL
jgi:poly(A) polymerase